MPRIIILFAALAFSPVDAGDYEDIVERAVNTLEEDVASSWSFTETSIIDDNDYVASYDPRKADFERWTLMSIEGRPPTDKEASSFRDDKRKADNKKKEESKGIRRVVRIHPGKLELIEETDAHWLFGFVPAEGNPDEKFMRYVDGTLKIVKDGHYVESIIMKNASPIKPAIGVKIIKFLVHLTFGRVAIDGPVVPMSVDVEVRGRAFLAVRFNDSESIRYSDYVYVGDQGDMVPDR